MSPIRTCSDYCRAVCSHIRFRPGRAAIAAELTAHIEDHQQSLTAQGLSPQEGEALVVEAMGDPDELGRALDLAHPWIWSYLYLVLRPVTLLVCVLVLGGFLVNTGSMLLSMLTPPPPYENGQAVIRYAEPDLFVTIGSHRIHIQQACQLENGEVRLSYSDLIFPLYATSSAARLSLSIGGETSFSGGSTLTATGNGLANLIRCQADFSVPLLENDALSIRISASGQTVERTILLQEVAP